MAGPFVVAHNRAVIGAPVLRVFDYLSDLSHFKEWNDEAEFKITVLPDGPPGPGTQLRREKTGQMLGPIILRGGMGDSQVTLIRATTITTYEPASALVLETKNVYNGLLHSIEKLSFDLQQEAGDTRVIMLSEVEAMVPSMFIGPVYAIRLARGMFERLLGGRLSGLFPQMSVGPHLAKIKERTESLQMADNH